MNPLQFAQMLSKNPQQLIQQSIGNNPMASNLLRMINKKDASGIEEMARNLAKEKGVNADDLYNKIKTQLGV